MIDAETLRSYKQIITYDGCVQYLQKDYYGRNCVVSKWEENERVNIQTNLLKNRKLGLVFDLDNTLMEVHLFPAP